MSTLAGRGGHLQSAHPGADGGVSQPTPPPPPGFGRCLRPRACGSAPRRVRIRSAAGGLGRRALSDTDGDEQPGFPRPRRGRQGRGTKDGSDTQRMAARVAETHHDGRRPSAAREEKGARLRRPIISTRAEGPRAWGRGRAAGLAAHMPAWKCRRPRPIALRPLPGWPIRRRNRSGRLGSRKHVLKCRSMRCVAELCALEIPINRIMV